MQNSKQVTPGEKAGLQLLRVMWDLLALALGAGRVIYRDVLGRKPDYQLAGRRRRRPLESQE